MKFQLHKYILLLFIFIILPDDIYCQQSGNESTILDRQQRERTPREIITGDTLHFLTDTIRGRELPGERGDTLSFLPEQDSAYRQALKLNIPVNSRLRLDLISSEALWEMQRELLLGSKWALAQKSLQNIPREWYQPTGVQQMQHHYNIYYSQFVEGIGSINPYGLKIPFSAIGSLFGLTEDLSPVMSYEIDYNAEIEIVIYSVQAVVVATIFSGQQPAGSYSYTWNGRDDNGRKMPPGDYIGEIRIGKERIIRKRIKL